MEETEPTTIRNILSKIFKKAQEEEDENIVLNHFLQIKAVLTMLLPDIFVKQETRGSTRTLRGTPSKISEDIASHAHSIVSS